MDKPKLLVVDDDEAIRTQLKYARRDHYTLAFAEDGGQAEERLREVEPTVVSLDLGLPPSSDTAEVGLKTLEHIFALTPNVKVVVVTGNSDRENAVRAAQLGAFDFHLKPIELEEYRTVLRRAALLYGLSREVDLAAQAKEQAIRFEEILGGFGWSAKPWSRCSAVTTGTPARRRARSTSAARRCTGCPTTTGSRPATFAELPARPTYAVVDNRARARGQPVPPHLGVSIDES